MIVMLLEMSLSAAMSGLHVYLVIFVIFQAVIAYILYRIFRFPQPRPYTIRSFIKRNVETRNSDVIIGHRGAHLEAPENTLAAFRKAKENGCVAVEFDLDLTKDGVPVVIHDDTVDRTTDGTGKVNELTFAEIRRLNASVYHTLSNEFPSESVPSLEEAVQSCLSLGLQMYIDVKTPRNASKISVLMKEMFERHHLYDKAMVCSFYPNVIFQVRRADPNILTALTWRKDVISNKMSGERRYRELWMNLLTQLLDRIWELHLHAWVWDFLGIACFLCHKDLASKQYVKEWRERGVEVILWTVNHPTEKEFFTKQLKCAIMTDCARPETEHVEQTF